MAHEEAGKFSNGQTMTHWDSIHAYKRGKLRPQAVAFQAVSPKGIWTVQDQDLVAMGASGLQAQGHGVDEGIDTGAYILEVDDESVYLLKHGVSWCRAFAIEAEYRDLEHRVGPIF